MRPEEHAEMQPGQRWHEAKRTLSMRWDKNSVWMRWKEDTDILYTDTVLASSHVGTRMMGSFIQHNRQVANKGGHVGPNSTVEDSRAKPNNAKQYSNPEHFSGRHRLFGSNKSATATHPLSKLRSVQSLFDKNNWNLLRLNLWSSKWATVSFIGIGMSF